MTHPSETFRCIFELLALMKHLLTISERYRPNRTGFKYNNFVCNKNKVFNFRLEKFHICREL